MDSEFYSILFKLHVFEAYSIRSRICLQMNIERKTPNTVFDYFPINIVFISINLPSLYRYLKTISKTFFYDIGVIYSFCRCIFVGSPPRSDYSNQERDTRNALYSAGPISGMENGWRGSTKWTFHRKKQPTKTVYVSSLPIMCLEYTRL